MSDNKFFFAVDDFKRYLDLTEYGFLALFSFGMVFHATLMPKMRTFQIISFLLIIMNFAVSKLFHLFFNEGNFK